MLSEFSIIPLDHGTSMKDYVAKILDLVDKSGLDYELTAMGTLIEGEPAKVWDLLRRCHETVRSISSRVETRIMIDDREGAKGRLIGKVRDVEEVLGRRLKTAV